MHEGRFHPYRGLPRALPHVRTGTFANIAAMKHAVGSYALVLFLENPSSIVIGRAGEFCFPAGHYLYCGSALGGLAPRIARHLRRRKRPRWHIDYLVQEAKVVEVWVTFSEERLECVLAAAAATLQAATIPARRFGSSDCRCPAHLLHLPHRPTHNDLEAAVRQVLKRRVAVRRLSLPPASSSHRKR